MENNNTTLQSQEEIPELILDDAEVKLIDIYDQLSVEEDITVMLAELIGSVTSFAYGLTLANEVNGRQGKNRTTYTAEHRKLMKYEELDTFDANANDRALELMTYVINVLLSDKQELPAGSRAAAGVLSYVKSLYVMIIAQEFYDLLPKLNTPNYIQLYVNNYTEDLHEQQEIIFSEWVAYVEDHESVELAEYTRDLGHQYWSSKANPGTLFEAKYRTFITKMSDFDGLKDAFTTFRARYLKLTRNANQNDIRDIFEINKNQFDTAKKKIMADIQQLTEIDDQAITLKLLVYAQ